MRDILELIAKIMKSDVKFIEDEQWLRPRKSEVFRLWGDNNKIKTLTGFTTSYDIEIGIHETVEWFLQKDNLNKYKADIYNV
jgi:nucleoside-diphosphate-sugar epimerase